MNNRKLEIYFFIALLLGILFVSFSILRPFIYALIFAGVFSIVFHRLYHRLSSFFHNKSIGAISTLVIVLTTVLIPLVFLGIQLFDEVQALYAYLITDGNQATFLQSIEAFINRMQEYITIGDNPPVYFKIDFNSYISGALSWFLQNFGSIFSSLAAIGINLFIFLFAFYYFLKNGPELKKKIIALSPLEDKYDEEISGKLELAINSVVKGTIVIALIQGVLMGIGLWIFGVPSPTLWGSLAAMAALIPGVGTALVSVPAIAYLMLTNHVAAGLGLLLWAVVIVGIIDNFLYPKLVQRGVKIHTLFILLFVFGGFIYFGPMGFLMGPITLSLLFALLDVYSLLKKEGEIGSVK